MKSNYKFVNYEWDDDAVDKLTPIERLVYRSNILGNDQRITNTGGGNTEHRLNDAIALRRATLKNKVPYCTNMSTALACIEGIKSLKTKELEVTSLQNI